VKETQDIHNDENDLEAPLDEGNTIFSPPKHVTRDFSRTSSEPNTEDDLFFVANTRQNQTADLIRFGSSGLYVSINDGTGGFGPMTKILKGLPKALGISRSLIFMADTTGNKLFDLIAFAHDKIIISRNNGNGTFQAWKVAIEKVFCNTNGWNEGRHLRLVANMGNGRAGIVGFGDSNVAFCASNGDGTFQMPKTLVDDFGYLNGWRTEKHIRFVACLGDYPRISIIGFGDDGVLIPTGHWGGQFQGVKVVVPDFGYNNGWRIEKHPRFVADLTGDELSDIIGFGDEGVYFALNCGKYRFGDVQKLVSWFGYSHNAGGWRVKKHLRFVVDITGNKCADIVGFYDDGVWVAFNTGKATFLTPQRVVSGFGYEAGGWRVDKHPRFLADLTGNGLLDIVGFGEDGVYVSFNVGGGKFSEVQRFSDFTERSYMRF
jgi:hypothetical protein